jgi:4-diphosphocytidyl-2C-methyl-D-erythritol kinase
VKAPAKINLLLKALARRNDGYHEIVSVMQAVGLYDVVSVRIDSAEGGASPEEARVRVTCDNPDVPADESNLACRAARIFLETSFPSAETSMHIHIEKHIPMAAGLAGGSADAAAVLLALARMSRTQASLQELAEIGSAIGADVAFCVLSCAAANPELGWAEEAWSAALAEGVGDRLTPFWARGGFALLVKPDVSVPTAEIYKAFDEVCGEARGGIGQQSAAIRRGHDRFCRAEGAAGALEASVSCSANEPVAGAQETKAETLGKELADGLAAGSAAAVFRNMHNDLESVTCLKYPVVAVVIEKMRGFCETPSGTGEGNSAEGAAANGNSGETPQPCLAEGGRVLMSGSGPTVFAYFFDEAEARAAVAKACVAFPGMQVFLAPAL